MRGEVGMSAVGLEDKVTCVSVEIPANKGDSTYPVWENRHNEAARSCRSERPLTHLIDSTDRQDAVKAINPSPPVHAQVGAQEAFGANPRLYQQHARTVFTTETGREVEPWAWISTTCGQLCLHAECMIVHSPQRIAYPPGVCVYCGFPAGTRDHLLPRTVTGDARRIFVAVVPACGECNSRISDRVDPSVTGRRRLAHDSLRRSKRKLLEGIEWTDDELDDFGPTLRASLVQKRHLKQQVIARLAWPEDPDYDLRAWQKSGIADPGALGLL
jgi:5-methylcytosine-specific restriction endonuclease McrA